MLISGLVIACTLFLFGVMVSGGVTTALFNVPALIIVFGATLGLAVAQSDRSRLRLITRVLSSVHRPFQVPYSAADLVGWAQIARKDGRLALESVAQEVRDELARQGLQWVVDGVEPVDIDGSMSSAMYAEEERQLQGAEFLEQLALYAPLMSGITAVIMVLQSGAELSDSALAHIGFVNAGATLVYGLALSGIVFLPLASRIRWLAQRQFRHREMLVVALLSMRQNEQPQRLAERLAFYSW